MIDVTYFVFRYSHRVQVSFPPKYLSLCYFLTFRPPLLVRFVGISRLYDNKHHVTDILSGALIGVGVAIFFGVVVLRLHESKPEREEEEKRPKDETHGLADYATDAT